MKVFALVGCGRVARHHAENIARVAKLKAVCDIIPERADAFAAQYSATAYYSLEEILSKEHRVEVMVVCTPNGFHAEHIIKSLQARKHVLTEKPLCLTAAAAWQIIETEKFCRRKLFVVKSARYTPVLQALKKVLVQEGLGKVYSFQLSCIWNRPDGYYTEWRGTLFPDGGTLYNQFSHYIDALLWLFGEVADVKGFAVNAAHQTSIEYEDTGAVALQMKNNSVGTFHWSVNAYKKNHEIGLTIVAEKGMIKIGGEYLNRIDHLLAEAAVQSALEDGTANAEQAGEHRKSHYDLYNHLMRALDKSDDTFAGAYEGLKTVETIEKIYKAVGGAAAHQQSRAH